MGFQQIATGIKSVVKAGIDYESTLAGFSMITGVTGKNLEDFGNKARALSKDFGGSAISQIETFKGVLSRLGPDIAKSPEALDNMARSINTLAKASGLDATASMDALTTATLQFGVDLSNPIQAADTMKKMMNTMAAGALEGAAEVPQITEALVVSGSAAKGAKVSFEELNAGIQVMAQAGKYGSEAGTGLRNVILKLQDGSGEGANTLKQMGLSYKELGTILTTQGLGAALSTLKTGLDKLGTAQEKNVALINLFGLENQVAGSALVNGADSLNTFTTKLTGTNTAVEQAAIRQKTLADRIEVLKAYIGDLFITISGYLMPAFTWISENFNTFIGIVGGVAAAILIYKGVMTGLALATAFQTAVQGGATTAMALFNAVAAANPISIIILLIAGLIAGFVLLYTKCTVVRQVIDALWQTIKSGVTMVVTYLKAYFINPWIVAYNTVKDIVSGLGDAISKFFSGDFKGAWNAVEGVGKKVMTSVKDVYGKNIETMSNETNKISAAWGEVGKKVPEEAKKGSAAIQDKTKSTKDLTAGLKDAANATDGVSKATEKVGSSAKATALTLDDYIAKLMKIKDVQSGEYKQTLEKAVETKQKNITETEEKKKITAIIDEEVLRKSVMAAGKDIELTIPAKTDQSALEGALGESINELSKKKGKYEYIVPIVYGEKDTGMVKDKDGKEHIVKMKYQYDEEGIKKQTQYIVDMTNNTLKQFDFSSSFNREIQNMMNAMEVGFGVVSKYFRKSDQEQKKREKGLDKKKDKELQVLDEELEGYKEQLKKKQITQAQFDKKEEQIEKRKDKISDKYESEKRKESIKTKDVIIKVLAESAQKQQEQENITTQKFKEGTATKEELMTSMAMTAGTQMAAMAATGEAGLGDYLKVMANTVLDYIQTMAIVWLAEVVANSISQYGPIVGAVIGAAGAIVITGLVSLIKGAIAGAEEGVIGVNDGYKKKPGRTDVYPFLLAKNESVLTAKQTLENIEYLEQMQKTGKSFREIALSDTYVTEHGTVKESPARMIQNALMLTNNNQNSEKLMIIAGSSNVNMEKKLDKINKQLAKTHELIRTNGMVKVYDNRIEYKKGIGVKELWR
jgi:TP901 family phage tail tape measure protein